MAEVYRMLLASNGHCDMCGEDLGEDSHIDHCHVTGRLRGIVHAKCNLGIGHAGDDPELLFKWQVYLHRASFDIRDLLAA